MEKLQQTFDENPFLLTAIELSIEILALQFPQSKDLRPKPKNL
jgi:hypothetical protein